VSVTIAQCLGAGLPGLRLNLNTHQLPLLHTQGSLKNPL